MKVLLNFDQPFFGWVFADSNEKCRVFGKGHLSLQLKLFLDDDELKLCKVVQVFTIILNKLK